MITLNRIFDDGFRRLGQWSELPAETEREIGKLIDGVKCFDIGDADEIKGVPTVAHEFESIKLPYQKCWFEFDGWNGDGARYGLLTERDHVSARCLCFFYNSDQRLWFLLSKLRHDEAGKLVAYTGFDEAPVGDDFMALGDSEKAVMSCTTACVKTMVQFLKMVACVNVELVELVPDAKLQKARKKRGKLPLFSSWICVLRGKQGATQQLGGTHASPRLHYRRGHVRDLGDGVTTWVRECMVGDKTLGLVEKTYARAR